MTSKAKSKPAFRPLWSYLSPLRRSTSFSLWSISSKISTFPWNSNLSIIDPSHPISSYPVPGLSVLSVLSGLSGSLVSGRRAWQSSTIPQPKAKAKAKPTSKPKPKAAHNRGRIRVAVTEVVTPASSLTLTHPLIHHCIWARGLPRKRIRPRTCPKKKRIRCQPRR